MVYKTLLDLSTLRLQRLDGSVNSHAERLLMKYKTVTSVVRSTPPTILDRARAQTSPDSIYDLELSPHLREHKIGHIDCDQGERFHQALSKGVSGQWVNAKYYPFVQVIIDWLRDEGVTKVLSEWEFRESKRLRGCCDLMVTGGPNRRGIVEIKLVNSLPEWRPPGDDQLQLGLYASMAALRFGDYHSYWGALAYVAPSNRTIRIFQFSNMEPCCCAANRVLEAA
jgi:hypothetical protein